MKQTKEIETVKRNIQNCKNNEKKVLMKIKQIQTELQQAKKKANVKEISNRLYSHSGGSRQASSVGSSSKAPSVVSNSSNGNNNNRSVGRNLVRQNLLKKTSDIRNDRSASNSNSKNNLLKTTPNIKTPAPPRKTEYKPPVRPVVSSHQIAKNNSQTKQGYSNNRNTYQRNDTGPLKSASTEFKKKEYSPAERDRQKQAIDRLTGGNKRTISNNKSNEKTSKERVPLKNNYTQKPGINGKKDNPKDILNRMKQVKAQYNTRSRNSINKNKDVTAKVAELTNKK